MPPQSPAAAPLSVSLHDACAPGGFPWTLRPHFVVLLATLAAAVLLTALTGIPILPFRPWAIIHATWLTKMMLCGVGLLCLSRILWRAARRRPITRRRLRAILRRHVGRTTLANALCFILTIETVLTAMTTLKQAIPFINRRLYDAVLVDLERLLHLGLNPAWLLARADLPAWWATLLDLTYYAWFAAMPLSLSYFLTHRDRRKREHMFAAFAGIFIVGVLWGLALPSHGPCYVDPASFPAPGMLLCGFTQNWLAERCAALTEITVVGSGGLTFGSGMMALPSLHVAVCVLYVVFFWREGPWLRLAAIVFALLIFLGSIQSGWHYALDGYGAVALVAFVVRLTAPLTRSWASFTRVAATPALSDWLESPASSEPPQPSRQRRAFG